MEYLGRVQLVQVMLVIGLDREQMEKRMSVVEPVELILVDHLKISIVKIELKIEKELTTIDNNCTLTSK